jgi:hypothetical protein
LLLIIFFEAAIRTNLLPTCVTPAAPDAVLIFWDSDVSDVNEDVLSSADKYTLRQAYRTNLLGTLDTIKSSGESSHHIISFLQFFLMQAGATPIVDLDPPSSQPIKMIL